MMDDLKQLFQKLRPSFEFRSITRELAELMLDAKPAGSVPIAAETWSSDWLVPGERIWAVIDALEKEGFWQVLHTSSGATLHCSLMASAAKAIGKKRKVTALQRIKNGAITDRADSLVLENVGPSKISEVSEKIPKDKRQSGLSGGYPGWLPSSTFGISGLVYRPDSGILEKISKEFQGICIDSCLASMFDDLKHSKDRPTIPNFPFWIIRWLKENAGRVVIKKSAEEISDLVDLKLNEY